MADGQAFPEKFQNPTITLDGSRRAHIPFSGLKTLWVNTGTLCNLACVNCYIESTPSNDRLVYITRDELKPFLEEARDMGATEIGFTGGEPFMNPHMADMAGDALMCGFDVLILTNAMTPMMRPKPQQALLDLRETYGDKLKLRVSLDHYTEQHHNEERGDKAFGKALEGLHWLEENGFCYSIAGRGLIDETLDDARAGYTSLFAKQGLGLKSTNPDDLVIFPEMDETKDTPEITDACWGILGVEPASVMCSSSRMLVKRKGADKPAVLACTLIAYDEAFEMGGSLDEARASVPLNHPHCSRFCVLGGASCSG